MSNVRSTYYVIFKYFAGDHPATVISCDQSSQHSPQYPCEKATDGLGEKDYNEWAVRDSGIGEWIRLNFDKVCKYTLLLTLQ